jgi:hypothetical protein
MLQEELVSEYNQLRSQAAESAKIMILRAAELLELMGHPLEKISSKLSSDFDAISDRYIRRILPEKYKQSQMAREFAEQVPQLLPRSQLIIALESLIKVGEELSSFASGLLHKLMESKDKLDILQSNVDSEQVEAVVKVTDELLSILESMRELHDDRVIISKLEYSLVKLKAAGTSLRHIAQQYHVSAKRISQIIRKA